MLALGADTAQAATANLLASVTATGTLAHCSGVTSVTHIRTGQYEVTFWECGRPDPRTAPGPSGPYPLRRPAARRRSRAAARRPHRRARDIITAAGQVLARAATTSAAGV